MPVLDWYFHLGTLLIFGFLTVIWSGKDWFNTILKVAFFSLSLMAILLVLSDYGYIVVTK